MTCLDWLVMATGNIDYSFVIDQGSHRCKVRLLKDITIINLTYHRLHTSIYFIIDFTRKNKK